MQSPLSLTDIRSPEKAASTFLFNSQLQLQPLPFAIKPTPSQTNARRGTSPQQQQQQQQATASLSQYAPASVPSPRFSQQPPSPAHQQQQAAAAAYDQTFQSGSDSFGRSVSPTRSQFTQQFGMVANGAAMDASFRSAASSASQSQMQMQQPARTAAAMSEMLSKAREGLQKLQAEVELERQRRQAAERSVTRTHRRDASAQELG